MIKKSPITQINDITSLRLDRSDRSSYLFLKEKSCRFDQSKEFTRDAESLESFCHLLGLEPQGFAKW
jgi:hypothetical protein